MELKTYQFTEIENAISDGYRSYEQLERMVRIELGENLEAIEGKTNLATVIFKLIRWAESTDNVTQLIKGAHKQNHTNELIAKLYGKYSRYPLTVITELPKCSNLTTSILPSQKSRPSKPKIKRWLSNKQGLFSRNPFDLWREELDPAVIIGRPKYLTDFENLLQPKAFSSIEGDCIAFAFQFASQLEQGKLDVPYHPTFIVWADLLAYEHNIHSGSDDDFCRALVPEFTETWLQWIIDAPGSFLQLTDAQQSSLAQCFTFCYDNIEQVIERLYFEGSNLVECSPHSRRYATELITLTMSD